MHQVDLSGAAFKNPRKQGDIGLAAAIYHFSRLGHEVFTPLTEATRSDLIVIPPDGGAPLRVQCKTTRHQTSITSYEVALSTGGGNRSWNGTHKTIDASEVDLVFVWCANDSTWIFPAEHVAGRRTIACGWATREFQVGGPEPSKPKYPERVSVKGRTRAAAAQRKTCADCPALIGVHATRCRSCAASASNTRKFDWPPVDDIKALIAREGSYLGAARVLGVSDNAVRKYLAKAERVAA